MPRSPPHSTHTVGTRLTSHAHSRTGSGGCARSTFCSLTTFRTAQRGVAGTTVNTAVTKRSAVSIRQPATTGRHSFTPMAVLCDTQIRELIGIEPFEDNVKRPG